MKKPSVAIISPALQESNSGNWQTARRWSLMLASHFATRVLRVWDGARSDRALIALHARKSADSIAAWYAQHGSAGLIVALTGTDLYRDIHTSAQAQHSLAAAARLIVLQELGAQQLAPEHRSKVVTLYQSTRLRQTRPKTSRHLNAVMVGHLRHEKLPQTLFQAALLLRHRSDIRITHIGASLDSDLGQAALDTAAQCPRYTWVGAKEHADTLARMQRAHVLVHSSKMEGGAHVVMEAVCCGTPVLASRIDGNVGLLGDDYAGYFPIGDAAALARLLARCQDDPAWLALLQTQCSQRVPLFSPQREQRQLRALVQQNLI